MTTTVTEMRSNKLVNMDIEQLRGWATFMDRAMVVSLVLAAVAIAAAGITTWLSFRFSGTVRAHEYAAIHRYKIEMDKHTAELQREVATARERSLELEQAVAAADQRAAQAARESAAANAKARSAENDAAEVRKRSAELGKAREATARAPDPAQAVVAEPPSPARKENPQQNPSGDREEQPGPIVAGLRRYAGTKAAVYVLDEAPDGPAAGATISAYLTEAGWAPLTWTWTGVSGIVGVVVLIKEGSDRETDEAASAVMEALRAAGFNVAKGNWPADWRRFRGTLNGPQTPGPTDAPIRIVIGSKAR